MKHKNLHIFSPAFETAESSNPQTIRDEVAPRHPGRTERELDLVTGLAAKRRVAVPLGKVAEILLEAAKDNRAWMEDFGEDLIEMDADLHEILMAYENMHTREAA